MGFFFGIVCGVLVAFWYSNGHMADICADTDPVRIEKPVSQ